MKQFVLLIALAAVLAGCAPNYVNLTPRQLPRTPESVHLFEVQWSTPRTGANNAEVKAYVFVAGQSYPMRRIPKTADRWEARVPLPPDRTSVPYYYKFDYTYPGTPQRVAASDRSPEYHVTVPRP